jgi:hypothetical protein
MASNGLPSQRPKEKPVRTEKKTAATNPVQVDARAWRRLVEAAEDARARLSVLKGQGTKGLAGVLKRLDAALPVREA